MQKGAAKALGGAEQEIAVPPLTAATRDGDLDVRRAAVRALAGWADRPEVWAAVVADPDADVRAYARRALAPHPVPS